MRGRYNHIVCCHIGYTTYCDSFGKLAFPLKIGRYRTKDVGLNRGQLENIKEINNYFKMLIGIIEARERKPKKQDLQ